MGIHLAENFLDLDVSSVSNFRAALAAKGYTYMAGTDMTSGVAQEKIAVDGENRNWFKLTTATPNTTAQKLHSPIGFPIPGNDKPYYLSMRLYLNSAWRSTASATTIPFLVTTRPMSTAVNTWPIYLDQGHLLKVGYNVLNTAASNNYTLYDDSRSFQFELYHAADGSFKVWIDENLVTPVNMTTLLRPTDGFVYISCYQTGQAQLSGSIYFNDVMVIDPSTEGLQYRPGRTARVESVPLIGDVTSDWNASAAGVSHYGIMNATWKGVTPAAEMLSAYGVGATERYRGGLVRDDLGQLVHAVIVESQMSNTAGAAHALDFIANFGDAGEKTFDNASYRAGAGGVYNRKVLDKNPNGGDWTIGTASSPVIGYTIKS